MLLTSASTSEAASIRESISFSASKGGTTAAAGGASAVVAAFSSVTRGRTTSGSRESNLEGVASTTAAAAAAADDDDDEDAEEVGAASADAESERASAAAALSRATTTATATTASLRDIICLLFRLRSREKRGARGGARRCVREQFERPVATTKSKSSEPASPTKQTTKKGQGAKPLRALSFASYSPGVEAKEIETVLFT